MDSTSTAPPPASARLTRLDEIRESATVRAAIGIDAIHRRLADGCHEITLRGQQYSGATLDQAIRAAREGPV